jgi:nicotinate-nucleotide adenylyltransferase
MPFAATTKAKPANPAPTRTPPHKTTTTAVAHRLRMTELLLAGQVKLRVCEAEIKTRGSNYTINTIRRLRRENPTTDFRLLLGADMALIFATWRRAETLVKLAPPLVAARPGYEFPAGFGAALPEGLSLAARKILGAGIFPAPQIDLSSRQIREAIALHRDYSQLPPPVAEYIKQHRLYERLDAAEM